MKTLVLSGLLFFSGLAGADATEVMVGTITASSGICQVGISVDGVLDCGRFAFVSNDLQENVAKGLEGAGMLILVGQHEVIRGIAYFTIHSVALQRE